MSNLRNVLSDGMYENVETISLGYEQMAKEIAYKMFEYGIEIGKKQ